MIDFFSFGIFSSIVLTFFFSVIPFFVHIQHMNSHETSQWRFERKNIGRKKIWFEKMSLERNKKSGLNKIQAVKLNRFKQN